ncbi:hypothetical protein Plim_4290 (plasmid) [Planctopirus limnophila DSM 3776]|uniref:ASCH domain-containing protein n=1 Tax=Planctopirus limnophila (strain ATCC 43296 / DSM 3776 / IFAM 1008 / Mu 290) TaxID=521674 RepID=D5SZH7_PLAL2|nr:hypothetical protein [Planctopirus limnophila]ADG70097.1 hypothetical protein Plim_4290 [Planctopirus limnophila DSM 3776]
MRNMSFMLTTQQILDRSKTVTRRLGWKFLKPGELLQACEKCQGLKPGEQLRKLAVIEVVSIRTEPLNAIRDDDVAREGFPDQHWHQFVDMFCEAMACRPTDPVQRIEFKYVDEVAP